MKSRKRMVVVGIIISVCFIAVIAKLSYVIFIKGSEYKQAAYAQQTKSQIISSNRGTIYDSKRRSISQKCFSRYSFI